MGYNFSAIEEKWLSRWKNEKAFEPKPNGKKFLLTVPWPYCNGALHIGHGRTYTVGDIVARYKRMRGFNVLYPMGFHISGTPVLAFSKKIEHGDQTTINLYKSYLELYGDDPSKVSEFSVPSNIASYFSERIINDFTNMGFSIDWTRKFTSGEPIYNKFVEWQFRLLQEKKLIKIGDYPILYSAEEGNPVGEDDILEGDTDKVSITQFTGVFFYVGNDILLASTVRPETLDGVTNIFLNPEAQYCRIRMR
ncbi:MAG: class I tRNA ligase family protein, partial [Candidatus Thermoplasmatota archaeon]|nr:class I tRNA ligase family protein [Candidatus Thermoplasmatota archaeon]